MRTFFRSERRSSYILILIFIILFSGIITAGYRYYQHSKGRYRVEVDRQLSAVAKLKVEELANW